MCTGKILLSTLLGGLLACWSFGSLAAYTFSDNIQDGCMNHGGIRKSMK